MVILEEVIVIIEKRVVIVKKVIWIVIKECVRIIVKEVTIAEAFGIRGLICECARSTRQSGCGMWRRSGGSYVFETYSRGL